MRMGPHCLRTAQKHRPKPTMIENDDGGPFLYWNEGSRKTFRLSFLKIATRAKVSKKLRDEGVAGSEL